MTAITDRRRDDFISKATIELLLSKREVSVFTPVLLASIDKQDHGQHLRQTVWRDW